MSNYDGQAESDAIISQLSSAAPVAGRVYEFLPDDAQLQFYSNGKVKPFIVVSFTTPFRDPRGRTIVGERQQPHIMGAIIACIGPDEGTARDVKAAVLNNLLDWEPTGNASPMVLEGGSARPSLDDVSKPSRFQHHVYFSFTINMNPDTSL